MSLVLVTGATGFIAASVFNTLSTRGSLVRGTVRKIGSVSLAAGQQCRAIEEIDGRTDWTSALEDVDCVIHCAARTQFVYETGEDSLSAYRSVNVNGTKRLAEQAAAAGLRRLVYLSSIKVNGEQTVLGAPFLFSDAPAPEDPYGVSKWEAEQALWAVSAQTGLEVVVVRPPLVYGPGVKGNLLRLLRWVARDVPLPLGVVHNQRSLVGLSNLVDLLLRCAEHPAAAGQTFLASDGQDLSTSQLIRLMAEGMNRPARLLPIPVALLQAGGSLVNKRHEIDRLVCSLQVDSGYTQAQLGWTPPVSVEDGVREMAQWYAVSQDTQAR